MSTEMTQMTDHQDGHRTVTLADLERMREREVAEVHRLEAVLGRAYIRGRRARRGGLVARNLERREQLKVELSRHQRKLATINAAIKSGRRAGNLMLLNGMDIPRNERELVATLYRLFIDTVPPADQTQREKTIMRMARDYVTTGVVR